MAIVRWNPWNLSSFFDEDWDVPAFSGNRLLGQGLNIYETEASIVTKAALPGISEDRVDVSIDGGIVRISATQEEKQEEESNKKYFVSSIASSYNYSFRLPDSIDNSAEPEAVLNNGVLTLTFKKVEAATPKKIKVQALGKQEKIEAKSQK